MFCWANGGYRTVQHAFRGGGGEIRWMCACVCKGGGILFILQQQTRGPAKAKCLHTQKWLRGRTGSGGVVGFGCSFRSPSGSISIASLYCCTDCLKNGCAFSTSDFCTGQTNFWLRQPHLTSRTHLNHLFIPPRNTNTMCKDLLSIIDKYMLRH